MPCLEPSGHARCHGSGRSERHNRDILQRLELALLDQIDVVICHGMLAVRCYLNRVRGGQVLEIGDRALPVGGLNVSKIARQHVNEHGSVFEGDRPQIPRLVSRLHDLDR